MTEAKKDSFTKAINAYYYGKRFATKDQKRLKIINQDEQIVLAEYEKAVAELKQEIETLKRDLRISVETHNEDLKLMAEQKQKLQQIFHARPCHDCTLEECDCCEAYDFISKIERELEK